MSKEEKGQLARIDQVTIPSNINLDHNPTALAEDLVKRIADLPNGVSQQYQFVVEAKGKGVFHDLTNNTSEIRPSVIRVTMTPFTSEI